MIHNSLGLLLHPFIVEICDLYEISLSQLLPWALYQLMGTLFLYNVHDFRFPLSRDWVYMYKLVKTARWSVPVVRF